MNYSLYGYFIVSVSDIPSVSYEKNLILVKLKNIKMFLSDGDGRSKLGTINNYCKTHNIFSHCYGYELSNICKALRTFTLSLPVSRAS